MTLSKFLRHAAFGWLLAAAATLGGTAHAGTMTFNINVAGIFSNEELGSAQNEFRLLNIGAGSHVIGIGWDVGLYADTPSWLSEMGVDFSNSTGGGFSLFPGFGDSNPGSGDYMSNGIEDLIGAGNDFFVGMDGSLRLEFFEAFNDYVGDWDGRWDRGTLSVLVVPEPTSAAMVLLALLAAGATTRRRAKSR